jgi:predicted Rossmann fold nucleotide-binding protein DprA/Smf involved in DNA uptake
MSNVRVIYAEMDGSDQMVRSVISQMAERVSQRQAPELPLEVPAIAADPANPARCLIPPRPLKTRVLRNLAEEARQASRKPQCKIRDGATLAAIVAALTKRPMSSGEVIKETHLGAAAVYSGLAKLRKDGDVESRPDETSIYPKQHLVKK